jgi:ligand-binding sensor domain-containing protein
VDAYISDLHVHDESIWATSRTLGGGRVFHSGDGGATWRDRSGGLPDISVNSIALDLRHPRMWVGTDCGVWESRDHGATWTPFATNLPNVMVTQIAFHAPMGLLFAGTRSRGVWEVAVDGWPAG